jgi:hypothetical protein
MPAQNMTSKPLYVKCLVSAGLFSTELYVLVHGSGAYVNAAKVKLDKPLDVTGETPGRVVAYLIEQSNDRALIEIPGEPVVGGLRTWVPMEELSAA